MVFEKVDEIRVNNLSKSDCKEYLTYLRSSLVKETVKVRLNEMRLTIQRIVDQLRKLDQTWYM